MRELEPRLPVRPTPAEFEALGGFLLRMTIPLRMGVGDLLAELQIPRSARTLERLTLKASPDEAREVAGAFGLTTDRVQAMTVRSFGDGALNDVLAANRALTLIPVCVRCVTAGYWDARWFTGLLTVCQSHRTALVARCEKCATLLGLHAVWTTAESPGHFVHRDGKDPCGGPGPTVRPAVDIVHASAVAVRLLDAIRGGDATNAVDAMRTVALLRASRVKDSARPAPAVVAGTFQVSDLIAAVTLVTEGPEAASQSLPMVDLAKRAARKRQRPRIPPAVDRDGRDRLRIAVNRARERQLLANGDVEVPRPGSLGCVDRMPSAVPADLLPVEVSDLLCEFDMDAVRTIVAIALVQPGGSASWASPTRALGLSRPVGFIAREAVREVHAAGREVEFWSAVARIRRELEHAGINFADRRRIVIDDAAAGGELVEGFASALGVRSVDASRWLLDRWACLAPRSFPPLLRRGASHADALNAIDMATALTAVWRLDLGDIVEGAGDAAVRRYA
ncbi:TniQ family protein [Cellulomonas endometrii]|uniref:TniQ family protein n=1 Tax=Cellulomonas endometrii TaxID=3036301 RepID=UPI0024ADDF04|nr:TniQ family protein [Cellulomonas endometrii]